MQLSSFKPCPRYWSTSTDGPQGDHVVLPNVALFKSGCFLKCKAWFFAATAKYRFSRVRFIVITWTEKFLKPFFNCFNRNMVEAAVLLYTAHPKDKKDSFKTIFVVFTAYIMILWYFLLSDVFQYNSIDMKVLCTYQVLTIVLYVLKIVPSFNSNKLASHIW